MNKEIKNLYISLFNNKKYNELRNILTMLNKYYNSYFKNNDMNLTYKEFEAIRNQISFIQDLLSCDFILYLRYHIKINGVN